MTTHSIETTNAAPGGMPGRRGSAWRAAHAPVEGVPRWARIAALVVTLTVLPSCVWRILGVTFHLPIATGNEANGTSFGMPDELYVVFLSVLSELLALTAYGMIARWGEVWPRWLPGLGGRRVPILAAAVPAALGAIVLTLLWTLVLAGVVTGTRMDGSAVPADFPLHFDSVRGVVAVIVYLPLVAWGPLLGALTVHYVRRRRAPRQ